MSALPSLLRSVLARTTWRIRVQRAVECGAWAVAVAASVAAAHGLFARTAEEHVLALGAGVVAACAFALLRPVRSEAVASEVDRRAELAGRVSAALEFARLPVHERTPFMEAALRDAERRAAGVRPSDVAPLARPRAGWLALGSLALWAAAQTWGAYETSTPAAGRVRPSATSPTRVPLVNELAPFERAAERLAREVGGGELAPELARYQQLVRELASGRTTSEQALRELFALEEALGSAGRAGSDRALVEALARELARVRGGPGQPGSSGAQARAALHELATALKQGALDARERAALARALARVRALREQAARSEDESVLRKEPSAGESAPPSQEQRVLEQKRRELEQLRRERAQAAPARRALERLQRELEQARSALAQNDARTAGDALSRGEQALSQLENGRALQRELEQLRDQLQREQSGAASAQGQPQPAPGEQKEGAPGEGNREPSQNGAGEGSLEQRRERFRLRALGEPLSGAADGGAMAVAPSEQSAADGDAGSSATGALGEPGAQAGADILTPGGGGAELVVPRASERTAAGGGDEHDERRGAPSPRREGAYDDRALEGARARGPTRSQVIRGAARGGFATAEYRRVYGDYRTHAEQLIERDDVPPGYRYYVRRYFQLVRPREGEEAQ